MKKQAILKLNWKAVEEATTIRTVVMAAVAVVVETGLEVKMMDKVVDQVVVDPIHQELPHHQEELHQNPLLQDHQLDLLDMEMMVDQEMDHQKFVLVVEVVLEVLEKHLQLVMVD